MGGSAFHRPSLSALAPQSKAHQNRSVGLCRNGSTASIPSHWCSARQVTKIHPSFVGDDATAKQLEIASNRDLPIAVATVSPRRRAPALQRRVALSLNQPKNARS